MGYKWVVVGSSFWIAFLFGFWMNMYTPLSSGLFACIVYNNAQNAIL